MIAEKKKPSLTDFETNPVNLIHKDYKKQVTVYKHAQSFLFLN